MATRRTSMMGTAGETDRRRVQTLKIGDVARLSGVGIETLRFYEKSGLLEKPARTYSGYRVYARDVLDRLSFIRRAQVLGFSLDEIKRVIDDARSGKSPCPEVREIVRNRLQELDVRIQEMRRYRRQLADTLDEWDRRGRAPGHICGLIEESRIDRGIAESGIARRRRVTGGRSGKTRRD